MAEGIELSIVIPNFNSGILLDYTLKSIFSKETSLSFEVLIMDNLSRDNPRQYIENYSAKPILFYTENDGGIYYAMNKGLRLAKGNWLIFLGAGDELLIDTVEKIKFNQMQEYKFIYANTRLLKNNKIYDGEFDLLKLMKRNISHQAIFYNNSIFKELGGFDINFKITADYIFNLKVFLCHFNAIKYVPYVVSCFMFGGLSDRVRDDYFQDNKLAIINRLVLININWRNFIALLRYDLFYLQKFIRLKFG